MRTLPLSSHQARQDWLLAAAAGFLALTCIGAVVDRRNGVVDRSFVTPRTVDHSASPPTVQELTREMLTHD